MYYEKEPEQWQLDAVIGAYHKFSDKYVTIDMLKLAHKESRLDFHKCRILLDNYIKTLETP